MMRLCGHDLAEGGICFTPVNLDTLECPKADRHVHEPLRLVHSQRTDDVRPVIVNKERETA